MIGFSIMMWFISIIFFCLAIALLRGNTSAIHGKTFDNTKDKVGYSKSLGKVVLFMGSGLLICGVVVLFGNAAVAIRNALIVLGVVVGEAVVWFAIIQKKYRV